MFCHRLRHRLTVDFASQQSTLQPAPTYSSDQHPPEQHRPEHHRRRFDLDRVWRAFGAFPSK